MVFNCTARKKAAIARAEIGTGTVFKHLRQILNRRRRKLAEWVVRIHFVVAQ